MKKNFGKAIAMLLLGCMVYSLSACSSKENSSTGSSSADAETSAASTDETTGSVEVTKVTFAIRQDLTPNSYVDEDGNPAGQNIDVAKLVDERLPQYEFEYDAVDADSILLGIDSGKYAGGLANYFWNEDREAKYIFPEKNISAGVLGFITTKAHSDLTSYEDVADQGLVVAPKQASDAVYATILEYNNANPDNPVKCDTVGEKLAVGEAMKQVLEGRYDLAIFLKSNFDAVKDEIDPNDELVFVPFTSIKTWVIYGKDYQGLADAFDEAMQQLEDDGTLAEISEKYYGENIYLYE